MAQYDVTSVNKLEYETTNGSRTRIVFLDATHFVICFQGDDADGYVETFSIASNGGSITSIERYEFTGNLDFSHGTVLKLDATHFAVIWHDSSSLNKGKVVTFSCAGDYTTIAEIDTLTFQNTTHSFSWSWAAVINSSYIVVAYSGVGSDGFIETLSFDGNFDNLASVDTLEHDTGLGNRTSNVVIIDSTHFAICYSGAASNDTTVKTFSVTSGAASITEIDSLLISTEQGIEPSLVLIDSTHLILAVATDDNDGFIYTISFDGSFNNLAIVNTLEHDTVQAAMHSLVKVDATTYALAYVNTFNTTSRIKIFTIDGSFVITQKSDLEFNTDSTADLHLILADSGYLLLVFTHLSTNDGFIESFSIEGAAPLTVELTESSAWTDVFGLSITKLLTEASAWTDVVAAVRARFKNLTDGSTWTDVFSRSTTKDLNETSTWTDVFSRIATFTKSLTETSTWTDVFNRSISRFITEASTWTDSLSALTVKGRLLFEASTWTDVFSRIVTFTKSLTEASTWTDAFNRSISRILTETSTWTDSLSKAISFTKSLTETSTWTDVFSKVLTFTKSLVEASTWTDLFNRSISRLLTEASTWTDVVAAAKIKAKTLTDSSTWTDAFSKSITKLMTETSTFTDKIKLILNAFQVGRWTRSNKDTDTDDWNKTNLPD